MFLQRGIIFTHEAVRDWERKLAPLLSETLRKRRHSRVGTSWYVDETFLNVQGRWQYRYRAIDRDGHLVARQLRQLLTAPHHYATSLHDDCPHFGILLSF
jgi:putative transposase